MVDVQTVKRLEKAALQIKINLLELCEQKSIHIGGDLSVCNIMTAIWQNKMKYDVQNPRWEKRDRFVLGKGHASAVTSFNQAAIGCYNLEDIYTEYATDFGRFGMHSCNLINPFVDVSTGSLGHGLPLSVGMALALKKKGNSESRVYCVMGDGEQNEGSIWEGVMAAKSFKLGNLIGIIDRNKMQFDGYADDCLPMGDLAAKYRAFEWNVVEIDGNSMEDILSALDSLPPPDTDIPTVIIANTTKGFGVSFMENNRYWHMGQVTNIQKETAIQELNDAYAKKWGNTKDE